MWKLADDLFAWEAGELSDQKFIELFSKLVKNGWAWSLQGIYGRTAMSLIEDEVLDRNGDILVDLEDYNDGIPAY